MFANLSGLFRTDSESILKWGLFVFLESKVLSKDLQEDRKDSGIWGVNGLSVR